MTEELYTIDTTPFRVKVFEPSPGPSGDRLRKYNALKLNIDRQKTIGDIEYDDSVLVEYLYSESREKVWAVCIHCGKYRSIQYNQYSHLCHTCSKYGRTKSEETRKKISCAHQGIAPEEFPGFVTEEHELFRKSIEYVNWRIAVFERDNYTCQECGAHGGVELESHHITPFHLHPEPEYSLDIDNGVTLCNICHDKTKRHEDDFYNKYTAIVKANSGFKGGFLESSVILEGLEKQNDPTQMSLSDGFVIPEKSKHQDKISNLVKSIVKQCVTYPPKPHSIHQPTIFDY